MTRARAQNLSEKYPIAFANGTPKIDLHEFQNEARGGVLRTLANPLVAPCAVRSMIALVAEPARSGRDSWKEGIREFATATGARQTMLFDSLRNINLGDEVVLAEAEMSRAMLRDLVAAGWSITVVILSVGKRASDALARVPVCRRAPVFDTVCCSPQLNSLQFPGSWLEITHDVMVLPYLAERIDFPELVAYFASSRGAKLVVKPSKLLQQEADFDSDMRNMLQDISARLRSVPGVNVVDSLSLLTDFETCRRSATENSGSLA